MLSNCILNFSPVFSFVYRKIGINVERARFLNLGQKPLNYKSAIDEPGVNQFAVSLNQHTGSLLMFALFWFSFIQQFLVRA